MPLFSQRKPSRHWVSHEWTDFRLFRLFLTLGLSKWAHSLILCTFTFSLCTFATSRAFNRRKKRIKFSLHFRLATDSFVDVGGVRSLAYVNFQIFYLVSGHKRYKSWSMGLKPMALATRPAAILISFSCSYTSMISTTNSQAKWNKSWIPEAELKENDKFVSMKRWRHSTEVAIVLLTQQHRVQFSAFPRSIEHHCLIRWQWW